MKELPMRKSIRLKGYDYSSDGAYFITICVKDRHELLSEIVVGDAPLRAPTPTTVILSAMRPNINRYGNILKIILHDRSMIVIRHKF